MTVYNWMTSSTVMNRQAATHVWLSLFTAYVDLRPEVDSSFTFVNELLSSLAIRSIDSDLVVRRTALECCELVFELAQGQVQGQVGQKLIKSEIKEKILTTEVETLYDGAAQFGEIISNFINFGFTFISSLIGNILQFIRPRFDMSPNYNFRFTVRSR